MDGGRRETQRTEMRSRLLEAALELFADRGYEATTINDIARRAEVARQTVLNHYPHKRDFVLAWERRRRDELVTVAADVSPNSPALRQLHRYFAALARMNEQERALTRELREQMVVPQPVPGPIVDAVRRGQARGEFDRSVDPVTVAEVCAGICADTLNRWVLGADPPFDLSRALADRLNLVARGLVSAGH